MNGSIKLSDDEKQEMIEDAEDIKRRDDLAQFLKPKDWEYI